MAIAQRDLMFTALGMMLVLVIPVIVLTIVFAVKYRADKGAKYTPMWDNSHLIETICWTVPAILVVILGVMVWNSTHALDPYKPLASDQEPLRVDVISLDWKYLFLYPDQDIGAVNELVFPVNRPLELHMTSGTVMTALMIPTLGGQIYAMGGMETELNLMAHEEGSFMGRNTMFSGDGFSAMSFEARSVSDTAFDAWVAAAKSQGSELDMARFQELAKPTQDVAPEVYADIPDTLFKTVIYNLGGASMGMADPNAHTNMGAMPGDGEGVSAQDTSAYETDGVAPPDAQGTATAPATQSAAPHSPDTTD